VTPNNEQEFHDWWNGDILPTNPYPKDSPVFWAWAGWQMGVKAEREACAKACDGWMHANGNDCAAAIRARGE